MCVYMCVVEGRDRVKVHVCKWYNSKKVQKHEIPPNPATSCPFRIVSSLSNECPFCTSPLVTGNWGFDVFTWICQSIQSNRVDISKHRIYTHWHCPFCMCFGCCLRGRPSSFVNTINSSETKNNCAWNPNHNNCANRH